MSEPPSFRGEFDEFEDRCSKHRCCGCEASDCCLDCPLDQCRLDGIKVLSLKRRSERTEEIWKLLSSGMSITKICAEMHISKRTLRRLIERKE